MTLNEKKKALVSVTLFKINLTTLLELLELLLQRVLIEGIRLGERNDLGLLVETVAIGLDLVAHSLIRHSRILARALHQMQQHPAAFHVA